MASDRSMRHRSLRNELPRLSTTRVRTYEDSPRSPLCLGRRRSSSNRKKFGGALSRQSVNEQTSVGLPTHRKCARRQSPRNRTGGRCWSKSCPHHPPAHSTTSLHVMIKSRRSGQPRSHDLSLNVGVSDSSASSSVSSRYRPSVRRS